MITRRLFTITTATFAANVRDIATQHHSLSELGYTFLVFKRSLRCRRRFNPDKLSTNCMENRRDVGRKKRKIDIERERENFVVSPIQGETEEKRNGENLDTSDEILLLSRRKLY